MSELPELPQIGDNLRLMRKKLRITLDELSRLSGVSKGMLSQIESGKANPTVASMWKISKSLGVDFNAFLGSQDNERLFFILRRESMKIWKNNEGHCSLRIITPPDMAERLEMYWLEFEPNGILESEKHYAYTEEFLTVIKGRLEVKAADKSALLEPGDSIRYHADVSHSIREIQAQDAEALLTVTYKDTHEGNP